jgi:hypothetical protein
MAEDGGSRGARPPSGAVGCALAPDLMEIHRPAAAIFFELARGARASAPEAGAVPGSGRCRADVFISVHRCSSVVEGFCG